MENLSPNNSPFIKEGKEEFEMSTLVNSPLEKGD
jgi:hypothetical protein